MSSWSDVGVANLTVLKRLQRASPLQHIKEWRHIPVLMPPQRPTDADAIMNIGVQVIDRQEGLVRNGRPDVPDCREHCV